MAYFFKGIVNAPARVLLDNLFENIEGATKWNKQLTECKKIHVRNIFDIINNIVR